MSNVPNQNGSGLEQQVSTYCQRSCCGGVGKHYINKRQIEVAGCRPTEDLLSIYNIVKSPKCRVFGGWRLGQNDVLFKAPVLYSFHLKF